MFRTIAVVVLAASGLWAGRCASPNMPPHGFDRYGYSVNQSRGSEHVAPGWRLYVWSTVGEEKKWRRLYGIYETVEKATRDGNRWMKCVEERVVEELKKDSR